MRNLYYTDGSFINMGSLQSITSADKTRQKQARKRSFMFINEKFEFVFNTVLSNAVALQGF